MKKIDRQRKITLLALSLALVVAVYLNWQYSRDTNEQHILTGETVNETNTQLSEGDLLNTGTEKETTADAPTDSQSKNYGDALLVASNAKSSDKYFEEARLTRQKSRDEALDTLQKSLKSAKISESDKKMATAELSGIIADITAETDVENLLKAKGFLDCVAFKSENNMTVAVQTKAGELTKQDAAKVRDVVLSKTSIAAQNIVVIEVK